MSEKSSRSGLVEASGIKAVCAAAVLGSGLVATVLGWKLGRTSYADDVRTICNAEVRTHWTLARDSQAMTEWIRARMTTSDGNVLYASLLDARPEDRAERIRVAAQGAGVAACPIALAYEDVAADARYRRDIQRVCSTATLDADIPDGGEDDGAAASAWRAQKVQEIESWIDTAASSPKTQRLAAALRAADGVEGIQKALRDEARSASLPSCDLARTLAR